MKRVVLYALTTEECVTPIGIYDAIVGEQTLSDTAYAGIVKAFIAVTVDGGKTEQLKVLPSDALLSLPIPRRGELLQHACDLARIITKPASRTLRGGNSTSDKKGEKRT